MTGEIYTSLLNLKERPSIHKPVSLFSLDFAGFESWFTALIKTLSEEEKWLNHIKLVDNSLSQTERDYWRGYLQCLRRIAIGELPTELGQFLLTNHTGEGTP